MFLPSTTFNEFEQFKEAALNWNLDLRLLSFNDFSSELCLLHSGFFQIAQLTLSGKVEQKGLNPPGFRSIIVPVSLANSFSWLNRRTESNQILFFPKDGTLDAVSFTTFNIFVVSIEENYLMQNIELLQFKNCESHFGSTDVRITTQPAFLSTFKNLVEKLFILSAKGPEFELVKFNLIDEIIFKLLHELELGTESVIDNTHERRDKGVKKAKDYINLHPEDLFSIPYLCKYSGLSQRSLEYGFRDIYGITPKQYIKSAKLNKIRDEISRHHDTPISHIASKYGFWHMGQFAYDFRSKFGRLPSEVRNKQ